MDEQWDVVAIIGVGAIGASIGLGLRERRLAKRVVGATRTKASGDAAIQMGAVDAMAESIESASAEAELVVVCTPVRAIADHVRRAAAAGSDSMLITDGGSTKTAICNQLADLAGVFVGSHPLAGTHETGPTAGRSDLLQDRIVVVTPTDETPQRVVNRVSGFWESLGSRVETMSAERHDKLLAASSHAPHAIASILAACTPEDALPWTATGWKDTTRIAQGDVDLWLQILRDNRMHTAAALRSIGESLQQLVVALEADDAAQITELLEHGRKNRDAVGN